MGGHNLRERVESKGLLTEKNAISVWEEASPEALRKRRGWAFLHKAEAEGELVYCGAWVADNRGGIQGNIRKMRQQSVVVDTWLLQSEPGLAS